ncbi:MAG: hypothetical protein HY698_08870 [Deltaproteobacteria bacterium]|nr:hypothetical protein [Deltaproteobacteria bacterium]
MIISIVNFSALSDEEMQRTIRAINRQLDRDFEPYWHMGARLRLEGPAGREPRRQNPSELRGDGIVYVWDEVDIPGALGYHDANNRGIPYGFVFRELCDEIGEPWSVTLSHEALEMVGDANVNLLAAGPNPTEPEKTVFFWYEMCDAVQADQYEIDSVVVSNFVLPLYFTIHEEVGGRNDFLGRAHEGVTLRSFGINPGGYVGFFNPETGEHEVYARKGDEEAARRLATKARASVTRRAVRYRQLARRTAQAAALIYPEAATIITH